MDEKKLRQTIGSRTRARRKELKLTQGYLAEKMDVNKSTIQRYEKGTIDNTKKLIVEGLASALYVTPEYLRGETDTYESVIQNKRTLEILDAMEEVRKRIPLGISMRDLAYKLARGSRPMSDEALAACDAELRALAEKGPED